MATVSASEVQKDFAHWHNQAIKEPVQITTDGQETAYIVSAETFHQLWSCYRRAVPVTELTDEEMQMIRDAEIPPEHAYDLEDIPAEQSAR